MQIRILALLLGAVLSVSPLSAQQKTVTGRVTRDGDVPLSGVSVVVKGTSQVVQTSSGGIYTISVRVGQTLQYRLIGYVPKERLVGAANIIDVSLEKSAANLDAMVVTALGQTATKRELGSAQQTVSGAELAQTGRENFINALAGRVAGVDVTSSSGVPGSSSSITIRGVSSISGSNQPLMIVDGLPLDNKTLNTNVLASDAPGSATAFNNRGIDFTNRAADINPEDIETLVVLKGPEAAALYGIDAANGAIVITTKRGKAGTGGFEYSNWVRLDNTRAQPEIQGVYGPTSQAGATLGSFQYFGAPYAPGVQLFNNVDGFFRTAVSQQHVLTFSGATSDNKVGYRISGNLNRNLGVIPNSQLQRINLTGAMNAQVNKYVRADLSMLYVQSTNDQPEKGGNGPLLGLLLWPQTDNAGDFLSPAGTRRRITALAANAEVDNPYFSVSRNLIQARTNRIFPNLGLTVTPFSWGSIKTNIGVDNYTNSNQILRHPESSVGFTNNGIMDNAVDVTRNINTQTIFNINRQRIGRGFTLSGLVGHALSDSKSEVNAESGRNFLDPNFVSINNTDIATRFARTTIAQRRLVSAFGQAQLGYNNWAFVTVTGRNDWTSTIPIERNSFFYPSVQSSVIVSDAVPAIGKFMTAKVRASYAEVGRDARPYAYRPFLESKTTTGGGYGYGFTGPNLGLRPEFAASREGGFELASLNDRIGLDVTVYRKETKDQIVNDIRGSYGTGFILFNLNGARTRNTGVEVVARAVPVQTSDLSWELIANYEQARGRVLNLPNELPESYVSDTWLYGNIRNGVAPGLSTRSMTGLFYQRNNQGQLLIDPTTGLPIRSTTFIDAGYDRQPLWTMGVTNNLKYKRASVTMLWDFRRGGDVFNATQHFLTTRGLSMQTLDRDQARIVPGVLRDGRENSATPTPNGIVVIPAVQPAFYTGMSEELFVEKNVHWVRLRDVTLRMEFPGHYVRARRASAFIRGTDLLLFTNYSGLDPIVNGNTAAVGGSGAVGIDFGNFPMPRGFSFGITLGY
ncbi:SusC/RagA family TonB-linked outer membrane protein [Gemmatimonas sp.]|uniref:SusC/RagA family TonB-linked outer membrane protein n=1 Tax=Gemmatimonas sp. TaxID=1962908 RepID=UPI0022C9E445|nr:SusC/RagA family TonB-linked outer membrane protein [Gemmatimonas sp.]MCZ8205335.1 SusC/RagA family TonB-linked outer membrane protein [Gemmatimonas sp.]